MSKPVLLCIDDESNGLVVRKMLLESIGYSVFTAENGREGLVIFASHHVDAVILDYLMPEMNGLEVAIEMKRMKPRVPILLLSAYPSLPESTLASVDAFLSKGMPPREFFEQVSALLRTSDKIENRRSA